MSTEQQKVLVKGHLSKGMCTLDLQVYDLIDFCNNMGYEVDFDLMSTFKNWHQFHIYKETARGRDYLPLRDAVRLYNGVLKRVTPNIVDCIGLKGDFVFDSKVWFQAQKDKLFTTISIQRVKGELKVQSNWLQVNIEEPVDPMEGY